jgi:hypothetical protein
MKKTASILLAVILLLAFILSFGLGMPAAAAVNWDEFYIISQSPAELTIPFGSDFTLNLAANIPAGAEAEYQWHSQLGGNYNRIENVTGPTFHCASGDPLYPAARKPYWPSSEAFYSCTITAVEKDGGGNVVDTSSLYVRFAVNVQPERDPTLWENSAEFFNRWVFAPFGAAVAFTALIGTFTLGLGFLLFPFILVGIYFLNIVNGGGLYYTP